MVKFTERDVAIIAGTAGVLDFLTEGRFSAPVARALKKAIRRLGPSAVTATGRLAGTAAMAGLRAAPALASTARFITMRHPYIAAAVVTYEVVKNREQIAALAREGWEVIEPFAEPVGQFLVEGAVRAKQEGIGQPIGSPFSPLSMPKRRPSKFNSAIKAGMSAVKKSKLYGGKGKIRPATKVFSMVTKLARAKKKKKKAPKSGIRRLIWNAMKGLR